MKIRITSVGKGWVPEDKPDADPLYTIYVEGMSEPQKTWDADLAKVGEHEAEVYKSKAGKEYWRLPKTAQTGGQSGYSKSPDQQKAIQRQHSQHMALLYMSLPGYKGGLSTLEQVAQLTDWFEADISGSNGLKDPVPEISLEDFDQEPF